MPGHRRFPTHAVTLAAAAVAAAVSGGLLPAAAAHAATPTPPVVDFDGDGHADLAVGAPGGTAGGKAAAGYVSVVYGAKGGVNPARHKVFSQDTAGVPGATEAGDRFGAQVVPADVDHDGYTDLLVGAPGEDVGTVTDAGMITVLWGGPGGLSAATAVDTGASQAAQAGLTLAAGDFDADGSTDLAYATGLDIEVFSGLGRTGKPAAHGTIVTWEVNQAAGLVGFDLATGDVNGDRVTDLVMASHDAEDADSDQIPLFLGGSHADGSVGGLAYHGDLLAPQDTPGRQMWLAGASVAVGDVNGDGYADVVAGHTHEGYYSDGLMPSKGGAVGVVYGGPDGQSTTVPAVWINQDSPGVPGVAEAGDRMGADVVVGDVNGDGYADVVAGVPGEDFDGLTDPGAFLVLKGSAHGLTGTGSQVFSQNSTGLPGVTESHDRFGTTVTVLRPTATDRAQAAIGDPDENAGNGAVWVLHGAAPGLTGTATPSFGSATMGAPAKQAGFGSRLS